MSDEDNEINDQSGRTNEPQQGSDDLTDLDTEAVPGSGTAVAVVASDRPDALMLRKAPEAIFLKPVSGELTPLMHKAYNVLLARAAKQGPDERIYTVPLREIVRDTNFTSRDMAFFRECLKKLNGFQVEWDSFSPTGKRKGWGVTTLLSEAEIIDGELHFGFSERVKQQLLIPAIYQAINLTLIAKFRSRAAMALYEICLRYASSPGGLTVKRPWREWRDMLCGPNVKVDEWRYFRRDTLDPAQREIAKLTDDIEIERLEFKSGRTVTDIQFQVRQKAQQSLALGTQEENLFNGDLLDKLVKIGFTDKFATELLMKYDEGQIQAAIAAVEADQRKAPERRQIGSPTGYIRSSLEQGWKHAIAEEKAAIPQKPASKQLQDPAVAEKVAQRNAAMAAYEAATDDAKFDAWTKFLPALPSHLKPYASRGLKSKLIKDAFGDWLIAQSTSPSDGEAPSPTASSEDQS